MSDPSPLLPPEALLAQAGFVRALARSLVRDEAAAEDVEQETWLQALQSGPRRAEALPAWLRVVARNVAFKRLRGTARRRDREERSARPEAQPSAAERVEREQSLQGVVAAVMELPEAQRELVLMRYFEGLPPRVIAERLDLPVGTVRMRLHRALARLRRSLDREYGGDRARWMHGLALLAGLGDIRRAGALGGAAGPSLGALLLTLLGALSGLIVWWLSDPAGARPISEREAAGALTLAPERAPPLAGVDDAGARTAPDGSPRARSRAAGGASRDDIPPAAPPGVLVLDPAGSPVAGAQVLVQRADGRFAGVARTDREGRAQLSAVDPARRRVQLSARHPGFAPSLVRVFRRDARASESGGEATGEAEIVLSLRAGEARLAARVVDAAGRGIPDAQVIVGENFRLGRGALGPRARDAGRSPGRLQVAHAVLPGSGAAYQLDGATTGFLGAQVLGEDGRPGRLPGEVVATTGASGRVALRGLEPGDQVVQVRARGCTPTQIARRLAPGENDLGAVMLQRGASLAGRARRADGVPLEGGVVYAWSAGGRPITSARVGADGSFALEGLRPGRATLFAEGFVDGRLELSATAEAELAGGAVTRWDPELDRSARIRGRLADEGGRALGGWRVEQRLERLPGHTIASVTTAPDGTFLLPACPPAPSSVLAFEPRGAPVLETARMDWVRPGADLGTIVLTAAARATAIAAGTLLEPDGSPAPAGTQLLLARRGSAAAHPVRVESGGRFRSTPLPGGTYDVIAPDHGLGTLVGRPLELAPGGDIELGRLALPALGWLALAPDGAEDAGSRSVRLARPRDGAEPLVVFAGRAHVRARVEVGPGEWEVAFPGREEAPRRFIVRAGDEVAVRVPEE